MTTTISTPSTITVTRTIGRSDIGDATAADAGWQETVRAACEDAIETELTRLYPEAELDVTVIVGAQSALEVYADDESSDRLTETVRAASQRGFDAACAG
jgi:hypothetical protein